MNRRFTQGRPQGEAGEAAASGNPPGGGNFRGKKKLEKKRVLKIQCK